MVFGVGVSCRILYSFVVYLYVSCSGSITSVEEERANCRLSCNYVVSVRRGFFFLWVLGMGCIISFWHSLSLSYNYLPPDVRKQSRDGEIGMINRQGFNGFLALK